MCCLKSIYLTYFLVIFIRFDLLSCNQISAIHHHTEYVIVNESEDFEPYQDGEHVILASHHDKDPNEELNAKSGTNENTLVDKKKEVEEFKKEPIDDGDNQNKSDITKTSPDIQKTKPDRPDQNSTSEPPNLNEANNVSYYKKNTFGSSVKSSENLDIKTDTNNSQGETNEQSGVDGSESEYSNSATTQEPIESNTEQSASEEMDHNATTSENPLTTETKNSNESSTSTKSTEKTVAPKDEEAVTQTAEPPSIDAGERHQDIDPANLNNSTEQSNSQSIIVDNSIQKTETRNQFSPTGVHSEKNRQSRIGKKNMQTSTSPQSKPIIEKVETAQQNHLDTKKQSEEPSTTNWNTSIDDVRETESSSSDPFRLLSLEIAVYTIFCVIFVAVIFWFKSFLDNSNLNRLSIPNEKKFDTTRPNSSYQEISPRGKTPIMLLEEKKRKLEESNKQLMRKLELVPLLVNVKKLQQQQLDSNTKIAKNILSKLATYESLNGKNEELKKKLKDARYDQMLLLRNLIDLDDLNDIMRDVEYSRMFHLIKESKAKMEVEIEFFGDQIELFRQLDKQQNDIYISLTKEIHHEEEINEMHISKVKELELERKRIEDETDKQLEQLRLSPIKLSVS